MFNNKNLQLASYGHLDFYYFQSFLNKFENASLVNLNGDLLFSKDSQYEPTTTSRLVSFQIVKRYLSLNPGDIFITNDPENGGYNYRKVFFISSLTPNLFLIWCENISEIGFKIPLSPLVENHKKNALLWAAMIDTQPEAQALNSFFEHQILNYTSCFNATPYLDFLSEPDFQDIWFTTCKSEFDRQFDLRATGQTELSLKHYDKLIKTCLTIEERQNQKSLILDFSNTQLADKICTASHIVESTLIQEIVQFYNLGFFLSQPILNQIKLMMPPKSVISKAHSLGQYNFEFQSLFKQVIQHLFKKLNNSKKADPKFILKSEASMHFSEINAKALLLDHFFQFDEAFPAFKIKKQSMKDNVFQGDYLFESEKPVRLTLHFLKSDQETPQRNVQLNKENLNSGQYILKKNDVLSFDWKI